MKKTLREKILEILKQPTIHSNPNLFHTEKLEPILSIVREAVSAVKPKPLPETHQFPRNDNYINYGKNKGIFDYHSALMEEFK